MLDNSRRCKIGTGVGVKGSFFCSRGGVPGVDRKSLKIQKMSFFVRVKIGGKRFGNNELSGGC